MKKKSPKQQRPQPPADATLEVQTPAPPSKKKAKPLRVVQQPLPPDAAQRAREFYRDSAEIEESLWRTIYG